VPQTPLGAYSAAQDPPSSDALLIRGRVKGRGGKRRERKGRGRRKGEGKGSGGRGGEGKGRNAFPHLFNPTLTTVLT